MEKTCCFWLREGKKHSWFDCHHPFLLNNHKYQNQPRAFKKGRTWPSHVQEERRSREELFEIVSQQDPNVFGSSKQAQHRTVGYGKTYNWTKKSIFWELPYWPKLKIKNNIDFKHNEKNNGENFFFTMMDVKRKMKDTEASRKDLKDHTYRSSLHMITRKGKSAKPQANYTLTQKQQEAVHTWLSKLKTPDGFASNFARCSSSANFTGVNRHDMIILVQKLILVDIRDLLPKPTLGSNIVEILCKLEKQFPPAMFDVMEHLPVHLSYETLMGDHVHYRWMYPFEL
ncbi:hypothetical protein LIER_37252 [Lithospermum erythrorhizon]|uniref:DUF4218 domain-containing protein n=1 Tax=Lithospermum erythrorhizon TaxID=34254 RepID=A0AAV3PHU5_LITER